MKKLFLFLFLFLFTITLIFSCNSIFGQNTYKIVYKCDFEDGEDLTNWHLQNVQEYESRGLIGEYHRGMCDNFHIGNADAYSGTKSLYISEDGGITNNLTVPINISGIKQSIADLNINLPAGNYKLSFAYKSQYRQSLDITVLNDRFSVIIGDYFFSRFFENSIEWQVIEFEFTIPEGEEANWINFWYGSLPMPSSPPPTLEGVTIDNIVIKKDVGQSIYNVSGVVTNNDVPVTSGNVYLYKVETMSKYTLVDSACIENDGSYIFEAFLGAYIMKAESPNTENTVPTYYGDSTNWQQAKLITVANASIENLDIVMFSTEELGGGHGISGTVEEEEIEDKSFRKSSGQPAKNVDVRLEKEGIIIAQTFTNEQGYFEFTNVAQGRYKVIIDIPGLPMLSTHDVEITGTDDVEGINYTVTKNGIVKNDNVGIVETDNYPSLRIHPNPANDILYFSTETAFEIIDIQGKVLLKNENAVKFVNVSNLQAGIYFIKIDNQIQKMIKK